MYKFLLCMRYLTTRRIGLVSVVSIMLGVMTMIVVNSVMTGFRDRMRELLHGIQADVMVESISMDGFPHPEVVMETIYELVGDKVRAMTPVIEVFAMLHHQNQGMGSHDYTRPVRLVGIYPAGRAAAGKFREFLESSENQAEPERAFEVRGESARWRRENADLLDDEYRTGELEIPAGAIIGNQIARVRHGDQDLTVIDPGQEIILTTINVAKPPKPVNDRFVVTDVFRSDMSEYDSQYIYVPYEQLQQLRGMGNAATSIQIKLNDYADAPEVVAALRQAFNPYYYQVNTWEEKQGPVLEAVQVEAFLLNFVLFFIVVVGGFGILATFFMIVVEKTRDIGILKALGASQRGVMGIFLAYGLSLGLLGATLGTIFGCLIARYINPIEETLTALTGHELFPRNIYYFDEIPVLLDPWTVTFVVIGALVIAVAASVAPALRAARLRPVEALRYG